MAVAEACAQSEGPVVAGCSRSPSNPLASGNRHVSLSCPLLSHCGGFSWDSSLAGRGGVGWGVTTAILNSGRKREVDSLLSPDPVHRNTYFHCAGVAPCRLSVPALPWPRSIRIPFQKIG